MKVEVVSSRDKYSVLWKQNKLSLLQSWEWGEVKQNHWTPVYLRFGDVPFCILVRKFPKVSMRFGYMPRAFSDRTVSQDILRGVMEYSREELNLTHLTIDPDLTDPGSVDCFRKAGFRDTGTTIQPNQTNRVDLTRSEDEIMAAMKGQYRKNIRRAVKHGCEVNDFGSGDEPLRRFYEFMADLYGRTKYVMYGLEYFKRVWSILSVKGMARIYIISTDGRDVGASFSAFDEEIAYDLYGGISKKGRDLKAGYLNKWYVIKSSKEMGKRYFDHWGMAPKVGDDYDRRSSMFHISQFKKGFGGDDLQYLPQQTCVFNLSGYGMYRAGVGLNKLLIRLRNVVQ